MVDPVDMRKPIQPILEMEDLQTHFHTRDGVVKSVNGFSYSLAAGETLCIVGESGSGKSVAALSVLRLIPEPPGRIAGGVVRYAGRNLLELPEEEMRRIRGNDIAMIFQEPMTSLNPVLTIGKQIMETIILHQRIARHEAHQRATELLHLVGLSEPERRLKNYPHELSGGMRQRVMIAMAIACDPKVLIADEPTTALDVTIQAQILDLIQDIKEKLGTAVILITHDLGVVAETAQRVIVMYAGRKVEEAHVDDLFETPLHPYTRALLASVPSLGSSINDEAHRLVELTGHVPSLLTLPAGCSFAPRCGFAGEQCRAEVPPLQVPSHGREVACWRWREVAGGAING